MSRSVQVVSAGFALLLLASALVIGRQSGASSPSNTTVDVGAEVATTAPSDEVRSPESTAAGVVAMTGEVARAGFISRRDLIQSFCTPAFGPRLADDTSDQLDDLLLEFAERGADAAGLSVLEQPVRVRTISATPTRARVAVWSVLVVAAPGAATARMIWRTVTLDLELIEGEWLVDGWESKSGPTPMASPDVAITPADDVSEQIDWSPVEIG